MFTKEAQELAEATVEAIKKISRNYYNSVSKLPGGGLSETEWEWEPEVGQWYKLGDYIHLIKDDSDIDYVHSLPPPNVVIPLLPWERIEEILEGMGYYVSVVDFMKEDSDEWETEDYQAYICVKNKKDKKYKEWYGHSKDRQTSVMRAVIQLGKEK